MEKINVIKVTWINSLNYILFWYTLLGKEEPKLKNIEGEIVVLKTLGIKPNYAALGREYELVWYNVYGWFKYL